MLGRESIISPLRSNSSSYDGIDVANALEVIALLVKIKQVHYLELLLYCLNEGLSSMQDRAIEMLPRLCEGLFCNPFCFLTIMQFLFRLILGFYQEGRGQIFTLHHFFLPHHIGGLRVEGR